jgi:general secretion pathway protein G
VRRTALTPAPGTGRRSVRRHLRGFTIIELVVTLAILGILASAALPLAELAVKRTKENELRHALREIRGAIDEYKKGTGDGRVARAADATGYPPSLDVLAAGVEDKKDPAHKKIYFLRRIPRDPFNPEATSAVESWGRRSYESPPDNPRPGKDVFDVFSLSEGTGINGVPYREW